VQVQRAELGRQHASEGIPAHVRQHAVLHHTSREQHACHAHPAGCQACEERIDASAIAHITFLRQHLCTGLIHGLHLLGSRGLGARAADQNHAAGAVLHSSSQAERAIATCDDVCTISRHRQRHLTVSDLDDDLSDDM
jgi:hypothetical protein